MVVYNTTVEKTAAPSTQESNVDPYAALRAQVPVLRNLTKETFPDYTSLLAAYGRAIEARKEKPLLNDMYAEPLAGEIARKFSEFFYPQNKEEPEAMAYLVLRHLVIDEEIEENLDPEIEQVVVVGSGMDSRSYRLQRLASCHVFELDSCKELAEHKQQVLQEMNATLIPKAHDVILTNLRESEWPEQLAQRGFDAKKPTLWILEAVLEYLGEEGVDRLLTTIDRLSAPKSQALIEMCGSGAINMDIVMHDNHVSWNVGTQEKEHKGGILRAFHWPTEMLIQRDLKAAFSGRRWDAQRFAYYAEPLEVTLGNWYVASCTKPSSA